MVLSAGDAVRSAATVNRHLAAVFGLYEHHARSGVDVAVAVLEEIFVNPNWSQPASRSTGDQYRQRLLLILSLVSRRVNVQVSINVGGQLETVFFSEEYRRCVVTSLLGGIA